MKKGTLISKQVACLVVAGLLGAGVASAETVIKVGGSGGPLGSVKLLANAYMKKHQGVVIKVLPSLGSSGGIKATLAGELDIALSGRPLKPEEKAKGAAEVKYARSPFVFITHRKVNKKAVTIKELEDYYSGTVTEWPDGTHIRLVMRPESDFDTTLLRRISPAMDKAVLVANRRAGMNIAMTDQDSIEKVTAVEGSLGGATLTQVQTEKLPVKVVTIGGVKADVKAMAKASYPLWKELYMITAHQGSAAAKGFAAFFTSPEGKKILAASGNQPL